MPAPSGTTPLAPGRSSATQSRAASRWADVNHGQSATMRCQEFPASTQARSVVTGSLEPTNTATPPMIPGSQWMSDESDAFTLVTMLPLKAPVAGQGQTTLFDECVRTVQRVLVFSEPPRLPLGLHGRNDSTFPWLGNAIPQRPLAHRLSVLATCRQCAWPVLAPRDA